MDEYKLRNIMSKVPSWVDRGQMESPLEELFIRKLEKYISPTITIIPQYEIKTLIGKFRMDFVIDLGEKKIGFECDGAEFHDEWRDEWRDGLILGTGVIDSIYRFKGKDLFMFLDDCIYIIYHFDKEIFNDRYSKNFPQLISEEFRTQLTDKPFQIEEHIMIDVAIRDENDKIVLRVPLIVERRCKEQEGHWKVLLNYCEKNTSLTLDQIIKTYEGKRLKDK